MDTTPNTSVEEINSSLRHWKSIVAKYQESNTPRAIGQLFSSFGPFVALWIAMYFSVDYSIWLTLALGAVNAFFLVRIFIIQHDCGHYSFLQKRKVNDAIGFICSFFSSIPYTYWARVHSYHHGHTGQLEHRDIGDIDFLTVDEYRDLGKWGRFKYRIFRSPIVLFVVVPVIYLGVVLRIPRITFDGWGKVHLKQHINNISIAAVYIGLGFLLGWKSFLIVQGSIIFFFGIIAFWFFYVQHQHEHTFMQWTKNWDYLTAAIKGATFYKLPRWLHFLTGNIGYHHIHHLSSRIPNYNLRRCAKENPVLQKYVTKISFFQSLPMMFNKLWDEEKQRMISFKEFYQSEGKASVAG
ncbi:fatty acid desaturase [Lewinella sp. 4G2]|uniref:fatty acid desaturase n=1 Tax=Lewinella sp. 4G2 TaxID=1803372 RepID=UPI0007B4BE9C|nr:fatty acid desaturase [Lewinella sp. 4G2]OAV42843.1 portal protein [Lewinella sp. 4G2]